MTSKYSIAELISSVITNYKNALFNSAAILFTGGVGKLTTLVTFNCPCVEPAELPDACSMKSSLKKKHRDFDCVNLVNFAYGLAFIIVPAIAFFVIGLLLKQKLWKALTGHRYKETTESNERWKFCGTVFGMTFKALIYPATWISLSLLDGEYLACALTAIPYDLTYSHDDCWAVSQSQEPMKSSSFEANRRFSQTLGWILIGCFILIGFISYLCAVYFSPFTFFHAQFHKELKHDEELEFRKQIKRLAESEAEGNVKLFLNETTKDEAKKLWDKVASLYDFPANTKKFQHCTNLQQWAKGNKNCKEKPISTDDTKLESFEMSRYQ